jgi:superfamily I DNA/RNA helicase
MEVQAYAGRLISFLFFDECQDLLPRQLDVLACLCPRLENITCAADTAQTIEEGRNFAFAGCKDSFIKGNLDFFGRRPPLARTEVLHLHQNFRTTQQNCSLSAVIQHD